MSRILATALALSFAGSVAGASNLKELGSDCDPSLAASVGLGVSAKICTAATSRSNAGRVVYGAADGVFYPLGQGQGIVFDVDSSFFGTARAAEAGLANAAAAAAPALRAAGRASAGTPAAFPGNGLALGRMGAPGNGASAGVPPLAGGLAPELAADPVADGTDSDQASATPQVSPIPLPAAGILLLGGLGALGLIRRRRAQAG